MFPTHRLYLGGPPRYINGRPSIFGDTFLLSLQLFFFLSARDNETIRDRLTRGKSPLARHVSYCSFCVLKNCPHSHRQALSLYLWRAATISTTRCHQLPHLTHKSVTLAQYLATFRPFWRLFSHNRYILTNLFWAVSGREAAHSVGRNAAKSSVNH